MKMKLFPVIALVGAFIVACDKDIQNPLLEPYAVSSLDENAGQWKPYILSSVSDIVVPEPKPVTDPAYLKELDSLKNYIAPRVTPENRAAVEHWGAGAVYRWNEIARELSARYNLPPASNAEGKYPVPDAANPLKDPKFPFANPPYAARALAYLSVAQFDALVTAWNYKYKFNRKAPYKIDSGIKPLLPASDLPSYPSEAAVVAAASYTVLIAMFPGEVPYLDGKLAENKNAMIWAAMSTPSDITAGDALGKAVAARVMAKAKTDGMSAANNQSRTPAMIETAKSIGIIEPWKSQESPLRPTMLPTYGEVATWNFSKETMIAMRPPKPWIVGTPEFEKDLKELQGIQKNQTREQARIANFWADGAGSYTPPAHWHRIGAEAGKDAKYSEVRMARTLALLGTAEMDAGIACWDAKHYYFTPRPQQFGVKTSVGLPNFPSYTSGHSTFSSAGATVLSYIFPERKNEFEAMALEASNSRIYGLIHYRVDCEMGVAHGKTIGGYAVQRGQTDGSGL
ncbi:MAG TPA: phosphatase PAP2 family protein [Saprospiraceae bacterium]|nr:phosphatase PAP2 family protein [Saprospiraceae bacterium]HNT21310.1 phosphatase PAP2 family protein [Saprospiraceae bacterium]